MKELTELSSAPEHIERALGTQAFGKTITRDMTKDELLVVIGFCILAMEREKASRKRMELLHHDLVVAGRGLL